MAPISMWSDRMTPEGTGCFIRASKRSAMTDVTGVQLLWADNICIRSRRITGPGLFTGRDALGDFGQALSSMPPKHPPPIPSKTSPTRLPRPRRQTPRKHKHPHGCRHGSHLYRSGECIICPPRLLCHSRGAQVLNPLCPHSKQYQLERSQHQNTITTRQ
jgi:hypothetical protein